MPADVGFPHVNQQNVCQSHGEQRGLLFELEALVTFFLAIDRFDVKQQEVTSVVSVYPEALGRLLLCPCFITDFKVRVKEDVHQGALARGLAADDTYCRVAGPDPTHA